MLDHCPVAAQCNVSLRSIVIFSYSTTLATIAYLTPPFKSLLATGTFFRDLQGGTKHGWSWVVKRLLSFRAAATTKQNHADTLPSPDVIVKCMELDQRLSFPLILKVLWVTRCLICSNDLSSQTTTFNSTPHYSNSSGSILIVTSISLT